MREISSATTWPDREKFVGIGFMICWLDRELAVRSLETACNLVIEARNTYHVERHRPLQDLGCRGKVRTSTPLASCVQSRKISSSPRDVGRLVKLHHCSSVCLLEQVSDQFVPFPASCADHRFHSMGLESVTE